MALAVSAHAQDWSFDSLTIGPLDTQDGWAAPSQATVAADPTGGSTNFSGNVLSLAGGIGAASMNNWAVNSLSGTPEVVSFDAWLAEGIGTDPAELFVRFNSWSSYVAVKWATPDDPATGLIELPGGSLTGLNLPIADVFNIEIQYAVAGGTATSADVLVNGSLAGTIPGLSIDMVSGANVEFRSQKVQAYVDNFTAVPEPSMYAALLGLLALGFVAYRRRR